LAAINHMTFD